ncbi:hypothetical protein LJK88_49840 [Paenibacillus sp. P26]|nr:hypothetical protein LJK88_49840 [Paenibacillus sp. P26]UUZ91461.1 hypothetical protein LJK87_38485 [Paenibacillus sp. P25]
MKRFKPHGVMIVSILAASVLIGLMGAAGNPWVYLVLVFAAGLVMAPFNIALGGWSPQIVEPSMMGRVTAWTDPVLTLGQSVTLGLISLLYPKAISLELIYGVLAAIMAGAFALYAWTLPGLTGRAGRPAAVEEKPFT